MEPEIVSVAEWLNSCGANIVGAGTTTIEINGTSGKLLSAKHIYKTIPDRIEAGSFIILGAAGGVPVYQNYQLYVNFDKKGNPVGITSYHLHRAIDAFGGAQLDINHDKEWGLYASKKLKLPLKKIVIYVNDVWASFDKDMQHLSNKTDIRSWLFSVTDAYDPKIEDIDKRLSSPLYKKKIEYTLKILN
jgi:UDP-N-acetylglucosamine enolpyruvyl transferase